MIKYIDSRTHELRYTLKNKTIGEIYCVVLFTLLFGNELKKAEEEAGIGSEGRSSTTQPNEAADPAKADYGNRDELPLSEDDLDRAQMAVSCLGGHKMALQQPRRRM